MDNLLPKIYGGLSSYLQEHKAVSGEELIWKISEVVDSLPEHKKKELEEVFQADAKQMIFDGITGKIRLSVFSPDMHVQLNYLGELFYCPPTHKYMPDELEKAFKRLANLRFSRVSQTVEEILMDLIRKSGYDVSDILSETAGEYKAIKAGKDDLELLLFILPSIVFVPDKLEELTKLISEHVVVVSSENSPAPFVSFIRENMDRLRKTPKTMIWVVNPDTKTISPFMGTPKDKEIWKHLKDPEKSLLATQNWMRGAVRSRVLDEDF